MFNFCLRSRGQIVVFIAFLNRSCRAEKECTLSLLERTKIDGAKNRRSFTSFMYKNANKFSKPIWQISQVGKRFRLLLAQDCMHQECNRYCLKSTKAGTLQTCRSHYGTETEFGKLDTPGMELIEKARIYRDMKGISHFRMRRTQSVHLVQHSRSLLRGWRANCDIKLLLYYSNPSCSDISEIEDVCRYVVAYTGKRHNTSQEEKEAIQNIIMR